MGTPLVELNINEFLGIYTSGNPVFRTLHTVITVTNTRQADQQMKHTINGLFEEVQSANEEVHLHRAQTWVNAIHGGRHVILAVLLQ